VKKVLVEGREGEEVMQGAVLVLADQRSEEGEGGWDWIGLKECGSEAGVDSVGGE
jgi:hypothetical protein